MQLWEMTYRELTQKQTGIVDLFPDWSNKKAEVFQKGGIRLKSQHPGLWIFSVHFGKYDGHGDWYDVHLAFKNIRELVLLYSKDRSLWRKDEKLPDLRKVALKVMNNVDYAVRCADPSFIFWGYAYMLTQRDSIYGTPENRPPKKRNPNEKGIVCKHIDAVLNQLPYYVGTMANYIYRFYGKEVQQAAAEVLKGEKPKTGAAPAPPKGKLPAPNAPEPEVVEEEPAGGEAPATRMSTKPEPKKIEPGNPKKVVQPAVKKIEPPADKPEEPKITTQTTTLPVEMAKPRVTTQTTTGRPRESISKAVDVQIRKAPHPYGKSDRFWVAAKLADGSVLAVQNETDHLNIPEAFPEIYSRDPGSPKFAVDLGFWDSVEKKFLTSYGESNGDEQDRVNAENPDYANFLGRRSKGELYKQVGEAIGTEVVIKDGEWSAKYQRLTTNVSDFFELKAWRFSDGNWHRVTRRRRLGMGVFPLFVDKDNGALWAQLTREVKEDTGRPSGFKRTSPSSWEYRGCEVLVDQTMYARGKMSQGLWKYYAWVNDHRLNADTLQELKGLIDKALSTGEAIDVVQQDALEYILNA